jgi:hypothetical protein
LLEDSIADEGKILFLFWAWHSYELRVYA